MADIYSQIEDFLESAKDPLIVVLGPTASGKTAVSLKIAKAIGGEIISADSKQIYKGMEIATDAITPEESQGIAHHMIGIAEPDEEFSLADYKKIALQKIEEIKKKGKIPMLVGGTGLYISAIIEEYDMQQVPPNKELREKLEKEAEEKGREYVHEQLRKIDPESAGKIHPNNLRYVIRAIEINLGAGEKKEAKKKPARFDVFLIGVNRPRTEIYERINKRVDIQIERGVLEEVKKLLERGYKENLPSVSALGVKEYIPYIKGEKSKEECTEILKKNTRNYAKRQMTWWRKHDNITWLNPEEF